MLLIYNLFKIIKTYDFCREYMFVQSFRFNIKVTREQRQTQDKQGRQGQSSSQVQTSKSKNRDKEEDYYCMFIVIVLSKVHLGNNVYV